MTISIEELREIRDYSFPSKKVITPRQKHENHSFDNHGSFWLPLKITFINLITFRLRSLSNLRPPPPIPTDAKENNYQVLKIKHDKENILL